MSSGGSTTSKTKTNATTTPQIPSWEQQPFQNYYSQVSNLANMPATSFVTPATANQQQAFGRAGTASQPYQGTFQSLSNYSAPQVSAGQLSNTDLSPYMNPFQQDVINSTLGEFQQGNALGLNALRASTPSGAFNGSRQGVAEGQLTSDNLRTLASTLAGLNTANFSQAQGAAGQDIASRLQAAIANQGASQNAAGINLNAAQAGSSANLNDINQQAALGDQERTINSQNNPAVAQSQLLQLVQSLLGQNPAMYAGANQQGTSTTKQTSDPGALGIISTLADAIGSVMGGGGKSNPFALCDRRLKRDMRLLGADEHGNRWWLFRYLWDAVDVRRLGVMADEVPEAARVLHPSGFTMVDMRKLPGTA